jgi:hypothetical protein
MSCLDATFSLTPRSPTYFSSWHDWACLSCYGADFLPWNPSDISSLYATDRFYFEGAFASDPNLDYTQWSNRRIARVLYLDLDLRDYAGAQKQLALIFGFDVRDPASDGRVLVYSDAGLLSDQTLVYGDSQFLLEIESLALPLSLYFIHARNQWFFRGLGGYVV